MKIYAVVEFKKFCYAALVRSTWDCAHTKDYVLFSIHTETTILPV